MLLAGPASGDSAILDTSGITWTDLARPSGWRWAGNAVLRPEGPAGSSTVTQIGGVGTSGIDTPDNKYGVTSTETIDASRPAPTWHPDASLNVPRAHANTVLLPDGSMVVIGGGQGQSTAEGNFATLSDGSERQVELYDPQSDSWRPGPAQQEDRTYHSTAVLLPDGRVLSAGDNYHPYEGGHFDSSDTAEIYSPPYLFKGPRPVIASAPDSVHWADDFGVSTDDRIRSAVLMEPSATTHGDDMTQRQVPLRILGSVAGKGVNLAAPPSADVAPPGYYMLFLVNPQGVPSVAGWIRLDPSAPDRAVLESPASPAAPAGNDGPAPAATPPSGSKGKPAAKRKCRQRHRRCKRLRR